MELTAQPHSADVSAAAEPAIAPGATVGGPIPTLAVTEAVEKSSQNPLQVLSNRLIDLSSNIFSSLPQKQSIPEDSVVETADSAEEAFSEGVSSEGVATGGLAAASTGAQPSALEADASEHHVELKAAQPAAAPQRTVSAERRRRVIRLMWQKAMVQVSAEEAMQDAHEYRALLEEARKKRESIAASQSVRKRGVVGRMFASVGRGFDSMVNSFFTELEYQSSPPIGMQPSDDEAQSNMAKMVHLQNQIMEARLKKNLERSTKAFSEAGRKRAIEESRQPAVHAGQPSLDVRPGCAPLEA